MLTTSLLVIAICLPSVTTRAYASSRRAPFFNGWRHRRSSQGPLTLLARAKSRFVSTAYIPWHISVSPVSRLGKFSLADATGTFLGIVRLATLRT